MTLAIAFLGGLISCLSPCILPVLPVFTAVVGSGGAADLAGAGAMSAAVTPAVGLAQPGGLAHHGRYRAGGFLLGFAGVFVVLWVSIGLIGFAVLSTIPTLRPIAGAAIIALGAATILGWQMRMPTTRIGGRGSFAGSFLLGAGVAIGWTPCIGPTLGAILTMAAASGSVWSGALLLVAYAAGMAVPFVLVAVGLSRVRPLTQFLGRHHRGFEVVTGGLIVAVGILVATNAFSRLAGLFAWVF